MTFIYNKEFTVEVEGNPDWVHIVKTKDTDMRQFYITVDPNYGKSRWAYVVAESLDGTARVVYGIYQILSLRIWIRSDRLSLTCMTAQTVTTGQTTQTGVRTSLSPSGMASIHTISWTIRMVGTRYAPYLWPETISKAVCQSP